MTHWSQPLLQRAQSHSCKSNRCLHKGERNGSARREREGFETPRTHAYSTSTVQYGRYLPQPCPFHLQLELYVDSRASQDSCSSSSKDLPPKRGSLPVLPPYYKLDNLIEGTLLLLTCACVPAGSGLPFLSSTRSVWKTVRDVFSLTTSSPRLLVDDAGRPAR